MNLSYINHLEKKGPYSSINAPTQEYYPRLKKKKKNDYLDDLRSWKLYENEWLGEKYEGDVGAIYIDIDYIHIYILYTYRLYTYSLYIHKEVTDLIKQLWHEFWIRRYHVRSTSARRAALRCTCYLRYSCTTRPEGRFSATSRNRGTLYMVCTSMKVCVPAL